MTTVARLADAAAAAPLLVLPGADGSAAAGLPVPGLGPALEAAAAGAYALILLLLFPFGLHRLYLLWLRASRDASAPDHGWEGELPAVTVQIPVYNEANVVQRAVDAACRLEYPRDRLEVQILDDSDDETPELAARRVAEWRRRGVDVRHLRRPTREGYKAGALSHGAERASGEFFLVLDADFVPEPGLIRRLLPAFSDPEVGMVQGAWSHLNEGSAGWLTRAQALLLDAHFAVEHEARSRAGLYFNFNGTAGMWRRECLADAGGWEGDTLTEDLDLSYRAQLRGWKGVYRDDVRVAGELPASVRALEVQQERWAQGGVQTARKLLPAIWRSGERPAVKVEATSHLLGHLAHPLTTLLGVALAGAGLLGGVQSLPEWFHALALSLAVLPFLLFYGAASRLRGASLAAGVRRVAEAMTLGVGLGVPLSGAVARGAVGNGDTPFRRTPKSGHSLLRRYGVSLRPLRTAVRLALGALLLAATARHLAVGAASAVPFTLLFAAGYLSTALSSLREAPA